MLSSIQLIVWWKSKIGTVSTVIEEKVEYLDTDAMYMIQYHYLYYIDILLSLCLSSINWIRKKISCINWIRKISFVIIWKENVFFFFQNYKNKEIINSKTKWTTYTVNKSRYYFEANWDRAKQNDFHAVNILLQSIMTFDM